MKVFTSVVLSVIVMVSCAWAAPSTQDNRIENENSGSFNLAVRYLGSCLDADDMSTCLAVKGITALNRAARSNNIEIISGVTFKRDSNNAIARNGKALTENEVYAQLPEDAEERSGRLIDLAMQTAADFLGSHNLEVKVPAETTQEVARAFEEGRGKMKKIMGPLALAIGAKLFTVVPLVLGGLALLTTKAVIVAKIALLLALFVGGSRLFGGLGKGFSNYGGYNASPAWSPASTGGWSSAPSAAYPYARNLNDDAQQLAYAAQTPNTN